MATTSHRELRVWQIAMEIATTSYILAKRLPREGLFGLTSQIRRAAASVPANIAEGYGRYSKKETFRVRASPGPRPQARCQRRNDRALNRSGFWNRWLGSTNTTTNIPKLMTNPTISTSSRLLAR